MLSNFSTIRQLFHITEDNGFTENEILAYKKVCKTMPQALFEYYRQLGKCEFNQVLDNLLVPAELRLSQNQQFLIFYQESEGVCDWGIAMDDLSSDNPLIYQGFDEEDWQSTVKIQDFLTAMAYWQAIFYLPYQSGVFLKIHADKLKIIEQNFLIKPFYLPHESNIYFYGNQADEVISKVMIFI